MAKQQWIIAPAIMQLIPGKILGYLSINPHVPRQCPMTKGEMMKSERNESLRFNSRFRHFGELVVAKTLKLWYKIWLSKGPSLVLDIFHWIFFDFLSQNWTTYFHELTSPIMIIPSTFTDELRHDPKEEGEKWLSLKWEIFEKSFPIQLSLNIKLVRLQLGESLHNAASFT